MFSSQVDQFDIEAVKLQALEKIRVGHDGSGPGAGWFLDKIVITDPNDPTKEFSFPCERYSIYHSFYIEQILYTVCIRIKEFFLH